MSIRNDKGNTEWLRRPDLVDEFGKKTAKARRLPSDSGKREKIPRIVHGRPAEHPCLRTRGFSFLPKRGHERKKGGGVNVERKKLNK